MQTSIDFVVRACIESGLDRRAGSRIKVDQNQTKPSRAKAASQERDLDAPRLEASGARLRALYRVTPLARMAKRNQSHVTSGVPPRGGTGEGRAWRAPVIAV